VCYRPRKFYPNLYTFELSVQFTDSQYTLPYSLHFRDNKGFVCAVTVSDLGGLFASRTENINENDVSAVGAVTSRNKSIVIDEVRPASAGASQSQKKEHQETAPQPKC